MTEIEKLVEWLAETAFNAGYADCASTYDIPRRLTVIEADAANDAAKAALLAALKGVEGEAQRYEAECRGLDEECDKIHRRAEKAEAERDAAVAALVWMRDRDEIYGSLPSRYREKIDEAFAALASNSGGGA